MIKYLSLGFALILVAACNKARTPEDYLVSTTAPEDQPKPDKPGKKEPDQKPDPKKDDRKGAEPEPEPKPKPKPRDQDPGVELSKAKESLIGALWGQHNVGELLQEALKNNNLIMFEAFSSIKGDNGLDDAKKSQILLAKDKNGRNLLHNAAIDGKDQIVKFLLKYSKELSTDLNIADAQGNSPIALAAYFGQKNILEIFNDQGFIFDNRILRLAFNSDKTNNPTIECLVSKMSNEQINALENGHTLLDSLVKQMDLKKAAMLLKGAVDINLPSGGYTPLQTAVEILITPDWHDPSIAMGTFEPLHGAGMSYQKLNKPEESAGWAENYEYQVWSRQSTKARRIKMIQLLLEKGANVSLHAENTRSPFSGAAYFHEVEIMDELYKKNASIIDESINSGVGLANAAALRAVRMAMSKEATKVKNKPVTGNQQYVGTGNYQSGLDIKMLPVLEKRTNAALDKLKQLGVKSADFTLNILANEKGQIISWNDVGSSALGSYSWHFMSVQKKLETLSK